MYLELNRDTVLDFFTIEDLQNIAVALVKKNADKDALYTYLKTAKPVDVFSILKETKLLDGKEYSIAVEYCIAFDKYKDGYVPVINFDGGDIIIFDEIPDIVLDKILEYKEEKEKLNKSFKNE